MLKSLKISLVGLLILTSCSIEEGMEKAVKVDCGEAFKSEQERTNFFVEKNIELENKIEDLEDIIVNLSRPIDSAEVAVGYLKSNGVLKNITE